jgi:hypothetical protein
MDRCGSWGMSLTEGQVRLPPAIDNRITAIFPMIAMPSKHTARYGHKCFPGRRTCDTGIKYSCATCLSATATTALAVGTGSQNWRDNSLDRDDGSVTIGTFASVLLFIVAYGYWIRHLNRKQKSGVGFLGMLFQLFLGPVLIFVGLLHYFR